VTGRERLRRRLLQVLGLVLLLLLWWRAAPARSAFLPPLATVAREALDLARSGALPRDVLASLGRVLPGVGIALVAAALLALLGAAAKNLGALLDGVLELLRPIPPIAWAPIAILAFGIGDAPAVAIVTLGAFFPIWLGIQQGLRQVRLQHLQAARSFGAGRRLLATDVVFPSVLPSALHGLRVGLGTGWFCVVAAEMMGAQSGLGYGVQLFSLNLELGKTYTYLLLIGALGAAMNALLQRLEQRSGRWHRLATDGPDA
jgi:ABC-type nitrate/sulfonate/bicarbonate transport system permease component